jgi:hypothetical protein
MLVAARLRYVAGTRWGTRRHLNMHWLGEVAAVRPRGVPPRGNSSHNKNLHQPEALLDDQSSRAWLYGKLLVALLSQKLARVGSTISPWGYLRAETTHSQSVA